VLDNVPIDSEAHVVTSLITRFVAPTHYFKGARKGRVYAYINVHQSQGLLVQLCSSEVLNGKGYAWVHKDECVLVYVKN
jgi:hypothetical protein